VRSPQTVVAALLLGTWCVVRAFDAYLGVGPTDATPLAIARGGIFGGTRPFLEAATVVYDVIAAETLGQGHMGTEENLLRCDRVLCGPA
jgi:hypothetical protein